MRFLAIVMALLAASSARFAAAEMLGSPTEALVPAVGCFTGAPLKGSLQLKKESDPTKDQLAWKWARGTTTPADFGDPLTSTDFSLCVYDGVGTLQLAASAPGGSICKGDKPCWSTSGSGASVKFKYNNRGKPALPGGISTMAFATSAPGKGSLSVKGVGLNLYSVPQLPIDQSTPVRIQLVNSSTPVCWEATYGAPASSKAGDVKQFKDKND